jgi:hypothetical protein
LTLSSVPMLEEGVVKCWLLQLLLRIETCHAGRIIRRIGLVPYDPSPMVRYKADFQGTSLVAEHGRTDCTRFLLHKQSKVSSPTFARFDIGLRNRPAPVSFLVSARQAIQSIF